MKIGKKWLVMLLLCAAVSVCGCDHIGDDVQKGIALKNLNEGIYVQKNHRFYPLENRGKTSDEKMVRLSNSGKTGVIWLCEAEMNIPVCSAKDHLVIKKHQALPDEIFFQKMVDCGFTIGMTLSQTAKVGVYGLTGDEKCRLCPGSSAEKVIDAITANLQSLKIEEVGGVKMTKDRLDELGHVTDLKEGEDYPVGVYEGSCFHRLKIKADTRVFKSLPEERLISDRFYYTQEGYAEIEWPEKITPGFYYIGNAGMVEIVENEVRK